MKILHVTNYDRLGGAGIAAFRLHQALRNAGVDSRMLVRKKMSDDPYVEDVGEFGRKDVLEYGRKGVGECRGARFERMQRVHRTIQRLAVRGRGWLGTKITRMLGMEGCSLNIFPTGLHKVLNASDADVIHLHWINNEMISIKEIAKITKPLVWTLHDCWPFLGAEHHSDAGYWRKESDGVMGCGGEGVSEPEAYGLKSKVSLAVNHWIFKKKQKAWADLNVHFVAPSNWMAGQIRQSKLFADAPVKVIPNVLDSNVFKLMDKTECRKMFHLPQDKKLILFGAYNPLDPNKGCELLEKALQTMPEADRVGVELIVFGSDGEKNIADLTTHWLGEILEEDKMARLYSATDVFVCPSRKENLPNTVLEARTCVVPCVSFRQGGLPDLIIHKQCGWMAQSYSVKELCEGICWAIKQGGAEILPVNSTRLPNHDTQHENLSNKMAISISSHIDTYTESMEGVSRS